MRYIVLGVADEHHDELRDRVLDVATWAERLPGNFVFIGGTAEEIVRLLSTDKASTTGGET